MDDLAIRQQAVQLFARKLADALCVADDAVMAEVRELWKNIGPGPTCPNVSDLMRNLQHTLARGHVSRQKTVIELAGEMTVSYTSLLSPSVVDKLMQVVEQSFRNDHFVDSAKSTEGIYQRRQAPRNRFEQSAFALEFCLIQVGAANSVSQTISRVRTLLEDACLKQTASRVNAESFPKEKIVSQTNNHFHGDITGQVNVAGESIYSTQLSLSIGQIVEKIDASSATLAEKEEARSLLASFLAHPVVAAIAGSVAAGLVG